MITLGVVGQNRRIKGHWLPPPIRPSNKTHKHLHDSFLEYILRVFTLAKSKLNMRATYFLSTLLAATALASTVPQRPVEDAELVPIDDPTGNIAQPR